MNRVRRRQDQTRLKAVLDSCIVLPALRSEPCNHVFVWSYFVCSHVMSLKQLQLLLARAEPGLLSLPCETEAEWWLLPDEVRALLL